MTLFREGKGDPLLESPPTHQVFHPTAKMLVEISKSQDVEAGDGTTSVVVIAGALLQACQGLLEKGIHPTRIAESFRQAEEKAKEILRNMSIPARYTTAP